MAIAESPETGAVKVVQAQEVGVDCKQAVA